MRQVTAHDNATAKQDAQMQHLVTLAAPASGFEPRAMQAAPKWDGGSRFDLAIRFVSSIVLRKSLKNMKWPVFLRGAKLAPHLHPSEIWVAFLHDPHFLVNGEEGARSLGDMGRYHLLQRGKPDG